MKVDSGSSSVSGGGGGSANKTAAADSKPSAAATADSADNKNVGEAAPSGAGSPTDTVDVGGAQTESPNPYSDIADYSETVTAEKWTKDRTPAEGQVSRDDHLIGMLENRGFSQAEIYAKDAQGQTLFERVAAQNGLDDPNKIQEGGSYTVPSRYPPEGATQEVSANQVASGLEDAYADAVSKLDIDQVKGEIASNKAQAGAEAEQGDAVANAEAKLKVGEASDAQVKNQAEADAVSQGGDATATAEAATEVGTAQDSTVQTGADAQAASESGDATADAAATTEVGTAQDSTVATDSRAEAISEHKDALAQAESVARIEEAKASTVVTNADAGAVSTEGDAAAQAAAVTDIGTVQDSSVISNAQADAETRAGTPEAVADSQVQAEEVVNSTIDSTATAQTVDAEQPVAAQANTELAADSAQDVSVSDRAEVTPAGTAAVEQKVEVGDNQAGMQVDVSGEVSPGGAVSQDVQFAGDGDADVRLQSSGGDAEQTVINHSDTPAGTSATVIADGGVAPKQTIEGVETAHQQIDNAQVAVVGNDAQKATYVAEGNEIVTGYHTGRDGKVDISAEASERVFFRDGSQNNVFGDTTPTGNDIVGNVTSNDVRLQFPNSDSFNGTVNGTGDGVQHRVQLPEKGAGESTVVANQGSGSSFLEVTGADPNVLATKTDGSMQLNIDSSGGDGSTIALDAGKAALEGRVDLGNNDNSQVHIRTGGAEHNVDFQGGSGNNDTMFVHLNGDDPAPKVVLQEGQGKFLGLFGGQEEISVGSGDTQGVIRAPGFDNVVILRDGQVVDHYGQLPEGYQTFDQVADGLKRATQPLPIIGGSF